MALLQDTKIINDYLNNDLNGIYILDSYFFMPLRFTGTGLTIRQDNKENYYIIERAEEIFTNEEILNSLNGLPILLQHPLIENNKTLLNYETFEDNKIIGICIKAFLKGKEIWTIGRFYDLNLLKLFTTQTLSTSPCVVSTEIKANNGTNIEIPLSFNHLALCEVGYWDNYSNIKAIDNETLNKVDNDLSNCKIKENIIQYIKNNKGDNSMAINSADDIDIKDLSKTETKNDTNDNLEEDLNKRVENLEKVEKEEGVKMAEIANEHKEELKNKTDENTTTLANEDKIKEEKEKAAVEDLKAEKDKIEGLNKDELKDKIKQAQDNTKQEELKNKTDEDEETKEAKNKTDEDEDTIDINLPYNEDDITRDKIIETITNLCDSVDTSLGLKNVYVGKREKPNYLIHRILKANDKLVPKEYQQLVKSDSFIKAGNELANKIFNDFKNKVETEDKAIQKQKSSIVNRVNRYEKVSDYTYIDSEF